MTEMDLAPLRKILVDAADQSHEESEKTFSGLKEYGHLQNAVTFSYYYQSVCTPYDTRDDSSVQNALRLIGLASLIEAMMHNLPGNEPFEDFLSWWEKQKTDLLLKEFRCVKERYLTLHGTTRKFVDFVEQYFSSEDKEVLQKRIFYRGRNGDAQLTEQTLDAKNIARLLYQIRSDFVHAGQIHNFRFGRVFTALISVQGKIYDFRLSIIELLRMFERAFAKYVIQLSRAQ